MVYFKFKVCRKLGENIWQTKKLTPKQNNIIRLVIKKNTNQKKSDFSKKLQQMKILAYFYGMRSLNNHPGLLRRSFKRLDKKKSLLLTLESRLDVILVRVCFCSSLFMARQLIAHKKICVNSDVVNIPGFSVRKGDIISISPNYTDLLKQKIKQNSDYTRYLSETRAETTNRPNTPQPLGSHYVPPYHVEVNYKTFNAVLLYEAIQIYFPYKIDFDLLF